MMIKALRPNPLISYVELAKKLGLSSKTVRKRLSRLMQGNAVSFMPEIDLGRLEGASCVDLFVTYTASKFKGEVDGSIATKFQDYLLRAGWGSANQGHFQFLVPNNRVAQEILDWAGGLPGVRELDLYFLLELLTFGEDVFEEVFGERIRNARQELEG
jgi:DNA-binding Lrp family transcriptional regulator